MEVVVIVITVGQYTYPAVCYYHVTYASQSESTLYSCLNAKEPLAPNRRDIWSLSDSNSTRTHNHLVHKQTFKHSPKLAKWLSCVVSTCLYVAFDWMLLSCHVRISEWIYTLFYSCLNVKEILARNRRNIWSFSDSN